ncbi:hypothetical protein PV325_001869 [Microctonus aethiopoides]|nr:hypothetical protein PV325_001869 [Microctonus aethiopoides]
MVFFLHKNYQNAFNGRIDQVPRLLPYTNIFFSYGSNDAVPPRIAPFEMADKAVNWGESVSAVCTIVSGDAPLEISWALNGIPIANDNPHIQLTITKRNSFISIDAASPSHAGEYTCVASNGAGATSYSAELTVNVAPQIAPFTMADGPVNWGESISVPCSVLKGDLPIDISWALNGVPIRRDRSDINLVATTRKNSILSIDSVGAGHAGEYTCSASNIAGATSQSSTLTVNVAPQIVPFEMGDEPANWGDAVTATCTVFKGDFPIEIEWSLNSQPIDNNHPGITISTTKRVSLLTIDAVSASHAGEYTCSASNAAGGISYSAALTVNVAPQIAPFVMGDEPANWGDTVTATCTVIKGDRPIDIEWALNGEPISSHNYPDITIGTGKSVSLLTIDGVTASHAGDYTCTASNTAGGTSYSASLVVNVRPEIAAFTFGDEPANWDETVTATCTIIKGDYPISIEWSLNGESISLNNDDITIGSTGKRVSVLSIDAVSARHVGEYTCSASNIAGGTSYSASLAVNVSPEIAPFTFGEKPANAGDTVTAPCTVLKGDFPIDIQWALNGEPITREHSDITIVSTSKRVSILTIDGASARHAGDYTCTASNSAGGTSYSSSLAINVAPEIAPFVFGEKPSNAGDTVTAPCTVLKGDFPIDIQWALNGEPITRDHLDITIVSTSKRVSLLTIDGVSARHAGEYTCTASNSAGGTSYSSSLAVNVRPQIGTIAFTDSPANSGEPVSATCTILKGDFPMKISWRHNNESIINNQRDIVINKISKHMSVISIESAMADHAGQFTCMATNGAGTASQSTTLIVNAPFIISEEPANWSDTVTATCTVLKGDYPIDIEWAHNGVPINRDNTDITIVNTSKRVSLLTIEAVTARHAGEYSCSASNMAGGTSYTATLAVNGTNLKQS